MKCERCKENFPEAKLDGSHNVPCYLFEGNRKGRKNQADKFGWRWLCKKCHEDYEEKLRLFLRKLSKEYSKKYFKREDGKNS